MKRDKRPVREQIKSGLLIAGKLVAAFFIAGTFLSGCALIQTHQLLIGWFLVVVSTTVIAFTAKFWAAGFIGFITYGALRFLGGTLFADRLHMSAVYMLSVTASLFAMTILGFRFVSDKPRINPIDRASLVAAAICLLSFFLVTDPHRSLVVLNTGNLALLVSWWAARIQRSS